MRFWYIFLALLAMTDSTVFAGETWVNYGQANDITDVVVNGDNVWCATTNGLVCWDKRDMSHQTYTMKDGLPHSVINSLDVAPDGTIWCGTDAGVALFNGASWRVYKKADGLPFTHGGVIAAGPDGTVWVDTLNYNWMMGWCGELSKNEDNVWTTLPSIPKSLPECHYVIDAMDIAPDNTAWFLTGGQLYHHNGRTYTGLDVSAQAVEIDPNGIIWVGTTTGIKRYDDRTWSDIVLPSQHSVSALATPTDGTLWAGAPGGLLRYDGTTWTWRAAPAGMDMETFHGLAADTSGTVWIGTSKGLIRYDGTGFKLFRTEDELIDKKVLSLGFEPDGTVWAGTAGGVSRFDGHAWRSFTSADGLPSGEVTALTVVSTREVWIGTTAGAARYDGAAWRSYTTADGLPDNTVKAIAAGPDGTVWIGTNSGLFSFNGNTGKTYTQADGLPGNAICSVVVTSSGGVYAGGNENKGWVSGFDGKAWISYSLGNEEFSCTLIGMNAMTGSESVLVGGNFHGHGDLIPVFFHVLDTISIDTRLFANINGNLRSFALAPDGTTWLSSVENQFSAGDIGVIRVTEKEKNLYTEHEGLAGRIVNTIAIAPDGVVWFGTERGLSRLAYLTSSETGAETGTPDSFLITGNHPNPFNPATVISYTLPRNGDAVLTIYNIAGQKVRTLVAGKMTAGAHSTLWNGRDDAGRMVSSGVYIAYLRAGNAVSSRKMLLMK